MLTDFITSMLGTFCQAVSIGHKSTAGWFWVTVKELWSGHWLLIISFLVAITVVDRFLPGRKSENGFSATYNRFIGSGFYLLLQTLTYASLVGISSDLIYCRPWSYLIHLFVFVATGGILHFSRFWPYWRIPFIGKVSLY